MRTKNGNGNGAAITVGLATYRAVVVLFEPSRDSKLCHPEDMALDSARVRFLDSVRLTKWKAIFPMPKDPIDRAFLAEDLHAWGFLPGLADFEFAQGRPHEQIRTALMNMATKLQNNDDEGEN